MGYAPPAQMIPGWILGIFTAVMLIVAVASAARLLAARPWRGAAAHADIDAGQLLMGIAMAGMLTANLRTLPDGAWEAIFGALTGWFAWRVYEETRRRKASVPASDHRLPYLVHGAAMFYVYLSLAASAAAGAPVPVMQRLHLPTLALVFALLLVGYAVRDLDLLSGPAGGRYTLTGAGIAPAGPVLAAAPALASAPAAPAPPAAPPAAPAPPARRLALAPRLEIGCRIAIGVSIAFMLIITI